MPDWLGARVDGPFHLGRSRMRLEAATQKKRLLFEVVALTGIVEQKEDPCLGLGHQFPFSMIMSCFIHSFQSKVKKTTAQLPPLAGWKQKRIHSTQKHRGY
jgi:hypothetical protein